MRSGRQTLKVRITVHARLTDRFTNNLLPLLYGLPGAAAFLRRLFWRYAAKINNSNKQVKGQKNGKMYEAKR